jgi:hypothetical protein
MDCLKFNIPSGKNKYVEYFDLVQINVLIKKFFQIENGQAVYKKMANFQYKCIKT